MKIPELKLNTGAKIPQIGFGLWQNTDEQECKSAVKWALEAGFRHFDTAQIYGNEQFLGDALKESGVPREELFITTKIWNDNMIGTRLIPSFEESLKKLQMDYVDLLLLHFPVTERRDGAWRKMEQIYSSGKAKAIGVSNYTLKHLKEMPGQFNVTPAANQVEMSVVLQQPELVEYCKANGIVVEAYTPLVEGQFFDDPILKEIAQKHGKSVPQIMLRWCIDYGVVALTKSTHKDRIQQNIDIFDFKLDEEDMKKLKALDKGYRVNWNPTNVP
ncbi:MAG: putative reductase [Candidatus Saccharibacteria bacterium]|nr:putative reductase [Candidatus Saccharibacteria bacterium]